MFVITIAKDKHFLRTRQVLNKDNVKPLCEYYSYITTYGITLFSTDNFETFLSLYQTNSSVFIIIKRCYTYRTTPLDKVTFWGSFRDK